jgi:NAD+-dependent protein deacetylase sirtuin 2
MLLLDVNYIFAQNRMRTTPVDIAGLARFILSQDCQSITLLTGAGVSTASGIPDFRSPGGMYDTLRPELITATEEQRRKMRLDPTQVVDWNMFAENAFPYLEVRRPFILGTHENKWKATITHRFAELLHIKTKKLTRIYTQNIDGLDFQCEGIPVGKIVPIHGTVREASCEGCGTDLDYVQFCKKVRSNIKDIYTKCSEDSPKESKAIFCDHCQQPLVKPKTVLFGRQLPDKFFQCVQQDLPNLDLLIIAGTSLVVSPANTLVPSAPASAVRVIVNKEQVGSELGLVYGDANDKRDFFAQGECDDVFLELIKELGWLDDLDPAILPPKSAELVLKAQRESAYKQWF